MTMSTVIQLIACLLLFLLSVQYVVAALEVEIHEDNTLDSLPAVNSAESTALTNHNVNVSHSIGMYNRKLLQGSRFGCRPADIQIEQGQIGWGTTGIPKFLVSITNICQDQKCVISNIIVSCGAFNPSTLSPLEPNSFKRYGPGTCIVKNGNAMSPGENISFHYQEDHMDSLRFLSSTIKCNN